MAIKKHYEDAPEFSANAYRVLGWDGVAFSVYGWETEPDEDTEWSGQEVRTGNLLCVMVGDDRPFSIDPDDVAPLADDEYCASCGQIGCSHA